MVHPREIELEKSSWKVYSSSNDDKLQQLMPNRPASGVQTRLGKIFNHHGIPFCSFKKIRDKRLEIIKSEPMFF